MSSTRWVFTSHFIDEQTEPHRDEAAHPSCYYPSTYSRPPMVYPWVCAPSLFSQLNKPSFQATDTSGLDSSIVHSAIISQWQLPESRPLSPSNPTILGVQAAMFAKCIRPFALNFLTSVVGSDQGQLTTQRAAHQAHEANPLWVER